MLVRLRAEIEADLTGNLLPFWMAHAVDHAHGGFYGALTNTLAVRNDVPRSAILCARILWTYAAAARVYGDERYRAMARRAYDYLTGCFWDEREGGVYWTLAVDGTPVDGRKHSYAQAFAIYGLAEYFRATRALDGPAGGEERSLALARHLYNLLEAHAYDPVHGGYVEGCGRDWGALRDMRLSALEPNCRKSMNTLLHVLEAFTNLLRVWDDAGLRARQRALIRLFLERIIDPETRHLHLFFDDDWRVLADDDHVSPGHDIEASWLLVEAAEVQGDAGLLAEVRAAAVAIAEAVYARGRHADGAVVHALRPGSVDGDRHWWVQAEAVVGFYNAYQLSGRRHLAEAALQAWQVIRDQFIDRRDGEWFKQLSPDGVPQPGRYKVGPWECPYHSGRLGFEMRARLAPLATEMPHDPSELRR